MNDTASDSIFDLSVNDIQGKAHLLEEYKGKVLLIVNTASKCGFTSQYQGLQALHDQFASRGLVVMGFPCNQFGAQEPGTEHEIAQFCSLTYNVSFPMFSKVDVNGSDAHPLFKLLKHQAPGILGTEAIKWNFTKFLVDQTGKVVSRYAPKTAPADIAPDIERLLE